MPKSSSKKRTAKSKRSAAAQRGWKTRQRNAAQAKRAATAKRSQREQELLAIERLLGEDFESLPAARRALKAQQARKPSRHKPAKLTRSRVRAIVSRKKMWTVIVAAPYFIRHGRNRKTQHKNSPNSAAFMVQGWYSTEKQANKAIHSLQTLAAASRANVVAGKSKAYDLGIMPDVEIKEVNYDARFLGIIEETDER